MVERRTDIDWEAIEREYRAGQLSVLEIGRQFGLSHTAINKRAKRDGWFRNLADRVRKEVSARLVSEPVSTLTPETEQEAVKLAASRGVQVVREHQASIGRGQKLVNAMFGELEETGEKREEIEALDADELPVARGVVLRAIALPQRASVMVNLTSALKTLIGLERQAFNLESEPADSGPGAIERVVREIVYPAGEPS